MLVANNDLLLFDNAGTDPFFDDGVAVDLPLVHNTINGIIGSNNYDLGFVLLRDYPGGVAGIGTVCDQNTKGRGQIGHFAQITVYWHEVAHQYSATHTWNSIVCDGLFPGQYDPSAAYEPGSGTSIMSYQGLCGADNIGNATVPFFHGRSIDQVRAFVTVGGGSTCGISVHVETPRLSSMQGPRDSFFPATGLFF